MDFDELILDEMPGGVIVTGFDGVIVYWNKGAQSLFDYTAEEALQISFDDLVGVASGYCKIGQCLKEALEAGTSVRETLCRKKNGALIHTNIACKVLSSEQRQDRYLL